MTGSYRHRNPHNSFVTYCFDANLHRIRVGQFHQDTYNQRYKANSRYRRCCIGLRDRDSGHHLRKSNLQDTHYRR
jgi:hypothetical protein